MTKADWNRDLGAAPEGENVLLWREIPSPSGGTTGVLDIGYRLRDGFYDHHEDYTLNHVVAWALAPEGPSP